MKTIILSAAQMNCVDGNISRNLEHASSLALQACQQDAQLVLFPEFMPPGYRLTPELWSTAEPFDGPTKHWLCETAKKHNMYVGTSFLEARDDHFFNTFALAAPIGKIVGRVSKRSPSIWETYFFKGQRDAQYIDTELGRIGVAICFDNHTFEVANLVSQSNIDLMLMPHSYCTPTLAGQSINQADIDRLNNLPGEVARMYAQWFGIPVVLCNKSGKWDSPVPKTILGQPKQYTFCGRSVILDAESKVKAKLCDEEGVITGLVSLDPSLKKQIKPRKYSRYIYPGPAGREIFRVLEAVGKWNYTISALRRQKAKEIQLSPGG